MIPVQALGSGPGDKSDAASVIFYLPMLRGVVEFDVRGAGDFQPAKFVERHSIGPKTKSCAVGVE